jgi:predicted metalloendopeptidase
MAAAGPTLERMTLPSGIPVDELDPGIRPQDDLFRHVNGRWLARTEIPADRSSYGSGWILAEEAEKAVRAIVEEAASAPEGSEERKFGDLYATFMDAERAEQLGWQPISETLAAARAVSSVAELLETLGRLERWGIGGLYQLFVYTDPGNPQRYLVFFEQAAISLPDESYYREERFAGVRDAFVGLRWRDYSSLDIDPADLMANVRAAHAFEFRRQLNKIGQPVDRDEWFMTPQTVNAYNSPGKNEIVFPAAILQYPYFDPGRDDAANYAAIGAVIGHEIGHGFDDQGSKYDGDGRLTDWWSEQDRQAFDARTRSLIEQYNALAPRQTPDQHVNGALTIGENIGDLGGLGIAWKAYLVSLHGEHAPVIDGLTGAQRFFLSWARTGRHKTRDEELIRLLATDPHSPIEFRCNQTVRNLDEFYRAFGVGTTDELWLEPAARVRIW